MSAATSPMVSIYDGQRCVGSVLSRGRSGFEAFDADQKSLGLFKSQREAAAALVEEPAL